MLFFLGTKIVLYDLIYREMSIEKYKVVVNNVGSCECDLIQLAEFETRLHSDTLFLGHCFDGFIEMDHTQCVFYS